MSGKKKLKVAVLLGGDSAERDVSIASGLAIVDGLVKRGHDAWPVDPALPIDRQRRVFCRRIGEKPPEKIPELSASRKFEWLRSRKIRSADVVFIGLHGGAGEDGTVQAMLEAAALCYTGTGVLGSALAMNKDRSKALFNEAGVQTAPHLLTRRCGDIEKRRVLAAIESGVGFPVVVKPNCQGSSVGFSYVTGPDKLCDAIESASLFGEDILIERYVPGREVTVAILDGSALPVVEIIPAGGFYDYRSKYTKGSSRYVVPARIGKRAADRLKREAVLAYNALSCRDYARIDFRLAEDGETYCLEVNTLPGMTELSLVPMAASEAGMTFGELVEKICLMAMERVAGRSQGA